MNMSDNQQPQTRADNDRCVLDSWHEWEVEDGVRKIILCVQTGLELRPGYSGFDPAKLERLLADVADMIRTSASPIDASRITPLEGSH